MSKRIASYWRDKRVLITGASSGLGWALTEALAQFEVHFGLLSRRAAPMQQLADELSKSGSQFWIRSCDVRDREQVQSAVKAFHREAGGLDVVWVNSGVSLDSGFSTWRWANFDAMIETNINGAVHTTQAALELMAPQGSGVVVGVGSAAAMRGLPGRGVYSLTKAALEYFLLSKAVELPQIQFTIIHPGFVDTPINRGNPSRFWVQTPERAAHIMLKAVARKKKLIVFPGRMALLFSLMRHLPIPAYQWVARRTMNLSRPTRPGV